MKNGMKQTMTGPPAGKLSAAYLVSGADVTIQIRVRRSSARAKSVRGLTIAAVDIQLLMLCSPLRACAPVGVPRRLRCEAECD